MEIQAPFSTHSVDTGLQMIWPRGTFGRSRIAMSKLLYSVLITMPPVIQKWFYYGLFCECGVFLPLFEAPNNKDKKLFLESRAEAYVEIVCEVCKKRTTFNSDTAVYFVESSRRTVRFRPSIG
jgi:hypothetical protein